MGHGWKSLILKSQTCSGIAALLEKLCSSKITLTPTPGFLYQIDSFDYKLFTSGAVFLGFQYKNVLTIGYHNSTTRLLMNINFNDQQWIDPFEVFPTPITREISYRTKGRALLLQNSKPVIGAQLALLDRYNAIFAQVWLLQINNSEDCNVLIFGKRGYGKQIKCFLQTLRRSLDGSKIDYSKIGSSLPYNIAPKLTTQNYNEIIYPHQPTTVAISKLLLQALNQAKTNVKWIDTHPDPEFLHDLRTSMRKAKATLNYFESSIAQVGTETFQSELAYFMRQTSNPRNFEVLTMKLQEMTGPAAKLPSYPRILKHCQDETELQYEHLTGEFASARFEAFLAEWSRVAGRASTISLKLPYSSESGAFKLQNPHIQTDELLPPEQTFYEALTKMSSTLENDLRQQLKQLAKLKSAKKLHDIRKNFRNYKYLVEMVLYAWDQNKFSTHYPQIKKLVGWLGDLHDLYLEERLVQMLKCQDPLCQEEGARLSALFNAEYRLQLDQIRKRLKTLNRIDFQFDVSPISNPVIRK